MNDSFVMDQALLRAERTMKQNDGGPFGAAIVRNGEIIALASNTVLKDNDPTAHAEMNAIRKACKELGTYDLSDCELYATGYPCPMCLSAIMWANIKKIYVAGTLAEAERIGFRDNFIYEYISGENREALKVVKLGSADKISELYTKYKLLGKTIY